MGPSPHSSLARADYEQDLQVLSDATREILDGYANEDPLDLAATYGSIINKGVRRRTGRRPLPSRKPETVPASKATASGVKPINVKEESKSTANTASPDAKNSQSSSKDFFAKDKVGAKAEVKPAAEMKGVQKPPQLKRESSSIFKSFAKAKPKVKSEGGEPGSGIDSAIPSGAEDVPMKDDSDEEEDDYVPPPQASKELVDSDRKSRIERQAALRKMMEDEDEEEPPTNAEVKEQEELNSEVNPHSPVTEQAVEISDGRRRGRRRVMKKKTIKDEEGYLGKSPVLAGLCDFFVNKVNSYTRGGGLGVVFRGRTCRAKGKDTNRSSTQSQEASWQARAR